MALLSVMGLYQFDNTIFDTMELPEGVQRDVVVANILVECSELEILLPDPDVLKQSISYWSKANLQIWQKLYNSTKFEYNPIWNKDGTYTETETRNLQSTAETEATNAVSAFNSDTMRDQAQTQTSGAGTDTGTITRTRREQGNIGVTTTQQMIKEEREVSNFSIYAYITQAFKSMYCLGVY